jgi:hypothetical protein
MAQPRKFQSNSDLHSKVYFHALHSEVFRAQLTWEELSLEQRAQAGKLDVAVLFFWHPQSSRNTMLVK